MQEIGFFDSTKTGELISRLHTDIGAASDMVSQNVTVMIRSTLHIFVLASFMLITCWRLSVVSFVLIPFTDSVAKVSKGYNACYNKGPLYPHMQYFNIKRIQRYPLHHWCTCA